MRNQVTKNSILAHKKGVENGSFKSISEMILEVLKRLKSGTITEISQELGVSPERVHKRLSEMQADGNIYKTPYSKRSAETGNLQAIWALQNHIVIITTQPINNDRNN